MGAPIGGGGGGGGAINCGCGALGACCWDAGSMSIQGAAGTIEDAGASNDGMFWPATCWMRIVQMVATRAWCHELSICTWKKDMHFEQSISWMDWMSFRCNTISCYYFEPSDATHFRVRPTIENWHHSTIVCLLVTFLKYMCRCWIDTKFVLASRLAAGFCTESKIKRPSACTYCVRHMFGACTQVRWTCWRWCICTNYAQNGRNGTTFVFDYTQYFVGDYKMYNEWSMYWDVEYII